MHYPSELPAADNQHVLSSSAQSPEAPLPAEHPSAPDFDTSSQTYPNHHRPFTTITDASPPLPDLHDSNSFPVFSDSLSTFHSEYSTRLKTPTSPLAPQPFIYLDSPARLSASPSTMSPSVQYQLGGTAIKLLAAARAQGGLSENNISSPDGLGLGNAAAGTLEAGGASSTASLRPRPTPLHLNRPNNAQSLAGTTGAAGIDDALQTGKSTESVDSNISNQLLDLSVLRRSVQQNLQDRPLSDYNDTDDADSDRDHPDSDPNDDPDQRTRSPLARVLEGNLITATETLSLLRGSSDQLLIVDTRILDDYLAAHLPRSAHVSVPDLLLKRLRIQLAQPIPLSPATTWHSLGGFVSTPAGRRLWDTVDLSSRMDIIILGPSSPDSDDSSLTLSGILSRLSPNSVTRVLSGGWSAVSETAHADGMILSGESTDAQGLAVRRESADAALERPSRQLPRSPLSSPQVAAEARATALLSAPSPNVVTQRRSLPALSLKVPTTPNNPSSRRPPKLSIDLGDHSKAPPPQVKSAIAHPTQLHSQFNSNAFPKRANRAKPIQLTIDVGGSNRHVHGYGPRSAIHLPNGSFHPYDSAQSSAQRSNMPSADAWQPLHYGSQLAPNASPQRASAFSATSSMSFQSRPPEPEPLDFSTILPGFLFLGPEITSQSDIDTLRGLGVRRVLNVALECDDDEGLGIATTFERYLKIPMKDNVEETNVGRGITEACGFLDDARLHSAPTYVHCKAGKSRSVTVVLAYLIHANAWTLKTSYAYVAERRKGISPNIGFVAELLQYEEEELGLKPSGAGVSSGVLGHSVGNMSHHNTREPPATSVGDPHADASTRHLGHLGNDDSPRLISREPHSGPRYTRESMPAWPEWRSTVDMDLEPVGEAGGAGHAGGVSKEGGAGPNGTAAHHVRERSSKTSSDFDLAPPEPARLRRHSGADIEVRKNGQWVHHRRAPVDRETLQPGRRVSKAGLESMVMRPLED